MGRAPQRQQQDPARQSRLPPKLLAGPNSIGCLLQAILLGSLEGVPESTTLFPYRYDSKLPMAAVAGTLLVSAAQPGRHAFGWV